MTKLTFLINSADNKMMVLSQKIMLFHLNCLLGKIRKYFKLPPLIFLLCMLSVKDSPKPTALMHRIKQGFAACVKPLFMVLTSSFDSCRLPVPIWSIICILERTMASEYNNN